MRYIENVGHETNVLLKTNPINYDNRLAVLRKKMYSRELSILKQLPTSIRIKYRHHCYDHGVKVIT